MLPYEPRLFARTVSSTISRTFGAVAGGGGTRPVFQSSNIGMATTTVMNATAVASIPPNASRRPSWSDIFGARCAMRMATAATPPAHTAAATG